LTIAHIGDWSFGLSQDLMDGAQLD